MQQSGVRQKGKYQSLGRKREDGPYPSRGCLSGTVGPTNLQDDVRLL